MPALILALLALIGKKVIPMMQPDLKGGGSWNYLNTYAKFQLFPINKSENDTFAVSFQLGLSTTMFEDFAINGNLIVSNRFSKKFVLYAAGKYSLSVYPWAWNEDESSMGDFATGIVGTSIEWKHFTIRPELSFTKYFNNSDVKMTIVPSVGFAGRW